MRKCCTIWLHWEHPISSCEDLMKETRYHVYGTFVHRLSKGWLTSSVCLRKSLCINWLKVTLGAEKFEMVAKQKRFSFRFRSCLRATWHQPPSSSYHRFTRVSKCAGRELHNVDGGRDAHRTLQPAQTKIRSFSCSLGSKYSSSNRWRHHEKVGRI